MAVVQMREFLALRCPAPEGNHIEAG